MHFRSEMCCTWLAGNAGRKKIAINSPSSHYRTTLSSYIFASKACIDSQQKLVKQQYLPPPHMSSQYGELQRTNGWDLFRSLGHPSKFQRFSRLDSITARHSSSRREPNFAALDRGCHLYSAGRPSRWELAYILDLFFFFSSPNLSGRRLDVYHTSTHGVALVRI